MDPRRFSLSISIGYSVVTVNAVPQVALDPSTFTVLDEDTDVVYPAEPASAPGDCSANHVVALNGPDVTCTVHFLLPAAVGALSQVDGGVHATTCTSTRTGCGAGSPGRTEADRHPFERAPPAALPAASLFRGEVRPSAGAAGRRRRLRSGVFFGI